MFVYLMLIPIFLFATPQSSPKPKVKQNTSTKIVPRTLPEIVKAIKNHKKPITKSPQELLACLKIFEMNSNRDLNELYTEFLTSNPGSDTIDFVLYLDKTGISLSSRSSSTDSAEKIEVYQAIMITSTDKKALEGVREYSNEESISRYCIAYGLTRLPKPMPKDMVLIRFGNTRLGQFSKIYYKNGLYRIYYLHQSSFEAANFFERLNQGTLTFTRNITLLAKSNRF